MVYPKIWNDILDDISPKRMILWIEPCLLRIFSHYFFQAQSLFPSELLRHWCGAHYQAMVLMPFETRLLVLLWNRWIRSVFNHQTWGKYEVFNHQTWGKCIWICLKNLQNSIPMVSEVSEAFWTTQDVISFGPERGESSTIGRSRVGPYGNLILVRS